MTGTSYLNEIKQAFLKLDTLFFYGNEWHAPEEIGYHFKAEGGKIHIYFHDFDEKHEFLKHATLSDKQEIGYALLNRMNSIGVHGNLHEHPRFYDRNTETYHDKYEEGRTQLNSFAFSVTLPDTLESATLLTKAYHEELRDRVSAKLKDTICQERKAVFDHVDGNLELTQRIMEEALTQAGPTTAKQRETALT